MAHDNFTRSVLNPHLADQHDCYARRNVDRRSSCHDLSNFLDRILNCRDRLAFVRTLPVKTAHRQIEAPHRYYTCKILRADTAQRSKSKDQISVRPSPQRPYALSITDTVPPAWREPLAVAHLSLACRPSRPPPPAIRRARPCALRAAKPSRDARSFGPSTAGRSWTAAH